MEGGVGGGRWEGGGLTRITGIDSDISQERDSDIEALFRETERALALSRDVFGGAILSLSLPSLSLSYPSP